MREIVSTNHFSRRGKVRFCVFVIMFLISMLISISHVYASSREYKIKVAFIYNFAKFISWSKTNTARDKYLVVGIYGNTPFARAFASIQGRVAKGKRVVVKRIQNVKSLKYCQIVFVAPSEKGNFSSILKNIPNGILTVSDTNGFTKAGGIVQFYKRGNRIRFEINSRAMRQADVQISSRLLRLAKVVNY